MSKVRRATNSICLTVANSETRLDKSLRTRTSFAKYPSNPRTASFSVREGDNGDKHEMVSVAEAPP